jgi:hypothetical protein
MTWSKAELREIAEGDDLHISPFREDGVTYGTPTWIWSVAVDDALYVRAYNGKSSRCRLLRIVDFLAIDSTITRREFQGAGHTELTTVSRDSYRRRVFIYLSRNRSLISNLIILFASQIGHRA